MRKSPSAASPTLSTNGRGRLRKLGGRGCAAAVLRDGGRSGGAPPRSSRQRRSDPTTGRRLKLGAAGRGDPQRRAHLGYPWHEDLNAPFGEGVACYPVNNRLGWRISTNEAYLEPARNRPNLAMLRRAGRLRDVRGPCRHRRTRASAGERLDDDCRGRGSALRGRRSLAGNLYVRGSGRRRCCASSASPSFATCRTSAAIFSNIPSCIHCRFEGRIRASRPKRVTRTAASATAPDWQARGGATC